MHEENKTNSKDIKSFFIVPYALLKEPSYAGMTTDEAFLYGLLRDRSRLSYFNNWTDERGTFIIFTVKKLCEVLHCGKDKAIKLMKSLESHGLIRRQKHEGIPNKYYVKDLLPDIGFYDTCHSEKESTVVGKSVSEPVGKTDTNQSYINHNELSHNNPNQSIGGYEPIDVEKRIKENIEYGLLKETKGMDISRVDELIKVMTNAVCNRAESVRIGENIYPTELIRQRFLSYRCEDIEYVLDPLDKSTSKIRNIGKYLLATLLNAPCTHENYIAAEVNHDFV